MKKLIACGIIRRESRLVYWHSPRSRWSTAISKLHTLHSPALTSFYLSSVACAQFITPTKESAEWKKKKQTQQNGQRQYGTRFAIASWCAHIAFVLISACVPHSRSFSPSPIPNSLPPCRVYESNGESIWIAMNARRRWIHISIRFTSSSSGRCHRILYIFFFSILRVRCAKQMLHCKNSPFAM